MTARTRSAHELELVAKAGQYLAGGTLGNLVEDVILARGRGSRVWDVDGNEYIDYRMGHGALLLGHNHPVVTAALVEQAQQGTHYGSCQELAIRSPGAGAADAVRGDGQVLQLRHRGHHDGHAPGAGLHRPGQDPQDPGRLPRLARLRRDGHEPAGPGPVPGGGAGLGGHPPGRRVDDARRAVQRPRDDERHRRPAPRRAGGGHRRAVPARAGAAPRFPGGAARADRPARHPAHLRRGRDLVPVSPTAVRRSSTA